MASVSDDRAIEVRKVIHRTLAKAYGEKGASYFEEAELIVEALAGAGFQITDLTAEEAKAMLLSHRIEPPADPTQEELGAIRKLRRLSGASDA